MPKSVLVLAALALLAGAPAAQAQQQTLRVFLDCPCDFDYVRREIPFVNYVRDRQAADVHLLVTRETSGGGQQYRLNYIGAGRFASLQDTLVFNSSVTDTEEVERQGLVRVMKLGLMRFVATTPEAARIRIAFEDADEEDEARAPVPGQHDPWNFWTFAIGVSGSLDDESKEKERELSAELSANRTTEEWKLAFELDGEQQFDEIELADSTIDNRTHNWDLSALVVRSIGNNFAFGVASELESSVYQNYDLAFRIAPAIEYNFFPYRESSRRALVLRYYAGLALLDYDQETLFFKTHENLPLHALALEYGFQQTWGEADVSAEYSSYLHNTRYHRVSLDSWVSVNLVRGLSVDFGAEYERIRDQLSVPREDLSDEEVLLDRRQRLTGYRASIDIGLSYRFGSIFNNVVNPRMRGL